MMRLSGGPAALPLWHRLPHGAMAAAVAHGLRMAANLVIIKLIALSLGTAGLGAVGNLISVMSIVMVFAGGGIANGIAKYAAEYRERTRSLIRLMEAAIAIGISVSGTVMLVSVFAAKPVSQWLFGTPGYWWLSPLLGLTNFAAFVGAATIAYVNGHQRAHIFAAISICAYLGSIAGGWLLIDLFGFAGAAAALMLLAGSTAFPAAWFIRRWPIGRLVRPRFHRNETLRLLRFSAMTFVSAVTFPVVEIVLRTSITSRLGLDQAGLWQASIRLSGAILGFYTVFLATSFMPRVSAIPDRAAALKVVTRSLLTIGPVFALVAVAIWALRETVIPLLYSREFLPLAQILSWQLLGDTLRVCSYVIGFVIISQAKLKMHIAAELLQYGLFLALGLLGLYYGANLRAVLQAYAATYAVYFGVALVWLRFWSRSAT